MNTNPNPGYSSGDSKTLAAKACIWSIRNQQLIDLKELIRNGRGIQKPNEPSSDRRVGCRNSND